MKKHAFSIVLIFICLIVAGVSFVPLLQVKLSSSRSLPVITVSYSMSGVSGRTIETEVTSKLEAMLNRISGIKETESSSSEKGSYVRLSFNKNTSMDMAAFEVSCAVRQLWPELPENVSYPTVSTRRVESKSSGPFITYTLNATVSPIQINKYIDDNIKPILAKISEINEVEIGGALGYEWLIEYKADKLSQMGISTSDIKSAINAQMQKSQIGTGFSVNDNGVKNQLRIAFVPQDRTFDISKIPVKKVGDKIVYLSEIASIEKREQDPRSYYRINGLNTISIRLFASQTANQLRLATQVRETFDQIKTSLPDGYELHLSYDSTEYIRQELSKIYFRSGLTVLILLLFVLMISRSWRYLLMIVTSIVACLSISAIFYYILGIEIHIFSLAGITISLGLIIDNMIVMAEHLKHRQNYRVFLAILAATLTTIAALVVVLFLPEKIRLSLYDFAMVIIINMAVSLFVALFLVPSLMKQLKIGGTTQKRSKPRGFFKRFRSKRLTIWFNRFLARQIRFVYRFRVFALLLLILGFGLPFFMLPEKMDKETKFAKAYNATIGTPTYKEKIRPITDKWLGGTMRLFAKKVSEGSYYGERGETTINVTASMPNGTTLEQMNAVVMKMESYLTGFAQIRQFQTNVRAQESSMTIYFTKEHQHSGFPFQLKDEIISKAIEFGGASWGVYGMGDGFNNNMRESAGGSRVQLFGYNYDELTTQAQKLQQKLLLNQRIKEVLIVPEFIWSKPDYSEYVFELDNFALARSGVSPSALYSSVRENMTRDMTVFTIQTEYGKEPVRLKSDKSQSYDVWSFYNQAEKVDSSTYKLSNFGQIAKTQIPGKIVKINQQYKLCLQYDYIGSYESGNRFLKKTVDELKTELPIGYSVDTPSGYGGWGKDDANKYYLLGLIIVIIYFLCSILFNSLKLPFAVIFVIPVSFIGLFLTYYLLKVKLDEGGFAAMILLCGVTVNASIYILNDFNGLIRRTKRNALSAYIKAYNSKINSILLTILSTILGFIPFIIGAKESFWYPLAVGTIGGLLFSMVGIFFFLPLFMGIGKKEK